MSTAALEAADSVKQMQTGLNTQDSLPSKTIFSTESAAAGLPSVSAAEKCSELAGKESLEGRSQSLPPSTVTQLVRELLVFTCRREGFGCFLLDFTCHLCNLSKGCC